MNTRKMLLKSLEELVKEKSFDDITVQDILDRAEVARSTFYKHFRDKYDLSNAYYSNHVTNEILTEFDGHNWFDVLMEIACFVKSNKSYFRNILRTKEKGSFEDFLFNYGLDFYCDVYRHNVGRDDLTEEEIKKARFVSAGGVLMIVDWIKEECKTDESAIVKWIIDLTPKHYCEYIN